MKETERGREVDASAILVERAAAMKIQEAEASKVDEHHEGTPRAESLLSQVATQDAAQT